MKVNTLLQAETFKLSFINYMAAALHDQQFYFYIKDLPNHSIIVFEKANIICQQFDAFEQRVFSILPNKRIIKFTKLNKSLNFLMRLSIL